MRIHITSPSQRSGPPAFTLMEVLIAIAIFFMMTFAVLEIMTVGLRAARSLQTRHADTGIVASEYVGTNLVVEEGVESGDFGDLFPGSSWAREAQEIGSNGLYQVDFVVTSGKGDAGSTLSILIYSPQSPKGKLSGGTGRAMGPQPIR